MGAKTVAKVIFSWRACLIVMILTGFLCSAALADKQITGIDIKNKTDRVVIHVKSDSALKMTHLASTAGHYIGFQFPCKLVVKGRLVGIRSGRIHNVRYSSFSNRPAATRIVVNTWAHLKYSTEWSSDRKEVDITIWKFGVTPKESSMEAKPEQTPRFMVNLPKFAQAQASNPFVKVLGSVEVESSDSSELMAAVPEIKIEANLPVAQRIVAIPEQPKDVTPEKKVSLNFLGADINDVLKALSIQSGKNIVASKDVTGTITISLSEVSVDQSLDYVAKLSGYSYAKLNDTYIVGTKDSVRMLADGKSEESKIEVVQVVYANVDDVVGFLEKEYPQMKFTKGNGASKKDEKDESKSNSVPVRGGVIILSGPEGMIEQAKNLVAQIDSSMNTLMGDVTTEVYHIKYVNSAQLESTLMSAVPGIVVIPAPIDGFNFTAPGSISVGSGGGATIQQAPANKQEEAKPQALIISGPPSNVAQAIKIAEALDVKSPQIKIDAKVTSLTETGEKKLGLSWEWTNFIKLEGPKNHWGRQPWDFAATLEALITEGEGQLLAAPTLICLEGKPGVFFVGDEVRYVVDVQTTDNGRNVTTETANVGVQLRVIGDVSPDGFITLNLHPEVSVLKLDFNAEAQVALPIITRRFTDHIIRVKNGETIVIGGLIRDEEINDMSKVPILGDLPFLGRLFRHKHTTRAHSEVVMFITASILND